jgi:hypothetical protein
LERSDIVASEFISSKIMDEPVKASHEWSEVEAE